MARDQLPPCIETADINRQAVDPEWSQLFLEQNRLAERFPNVSEGEDFVVAEIGFGTGLNFLNTWRQWQLSNTVNGACLHYISIEHQPLSIPDLRLALSGWPELASYADLLVKAYPANAEGAHRVILDDGRVRLTLYFGDTKAAFKELDFVADAWFSGNFLSASLPDDTHAQAAAFAIAHHSNPGTTLSTCALSTSTPTANEQTSRLLERAGFSVSLALCGEHPNGAVLAEMPVGATEPTTQSPGLDVAIVGSGIAGTLLAANLAERGFRPILIDRSDSAGTGASGNRQGALYVKLGVDFNDQARLGLSSLLFSQRFYRRFQHHGWHPTGLIQLAYNEAEVDRQSRFLTRNNYPASVLRPVCAAEASKISGIPVPHSGLFFPDSGWLEPSRVCRQLSLHSGVKRQFSFEVASLTRHQDKWRITSTDSRELVTDAVVLCAGYETPQLIPLKSDYRIKPIRGQITEISEHKIKPPATVICGPGYVNPAHQGNVLVGATFDLHSHSSDVSSESNAENLRMLNDLLPGILNNNDAEPSALGTQGRVAFRCTTHDYQPIAGQMRTPDGDVLKGVYLFTGLGSKGLTYAPLLAEYLADVISDQPRCLPKSLIKRVETQRIHKPAVTLR